MNVRVMHFYKTYYPDTFGGTERVIHALATATRDMGIETSVLSLSRDHRRNSIVVDGHLAQKARLDLEFLSTGFSFDALSRFRRMAADADVIHYHFPWPVADVAHLLWARGRPALVTYHSDIVRHGAVRRLYEPLMHRFLSSVPVIVATSPDYARSSPVLRRYRDRLKVVPLGLEDRAAGVDRQAVQEWRSRLPDRFFLFTGTFRYYKGMHVLLEAARISRLPVVVIGGGRNERHWREQATRLGLDDHVIFLGEVPDRDKDAVLSLSTALVCPSHLRSEAFGLSLAEAAMFARPMVSCAIGTGTSYVNRAGETGIEVPPDDAPAFAGAMRRLAFDPGLCAIMGRAARQRYEALFTAQAMASAYAEIYRTLAGRGI